MHRLQRLGIGAAVNFILDDMLSQQPLVKPGKVLLGRTGTNKGNLYHTSMR